MSHQIYGELFGPFAAELAAVKHLIFEPDGAMLRLPPNLLVMDQASVDTYAKRAAAGGDAEFDFRGMRWLGRDRDICTVGRPRSFAQLRSAPPVRGAEGISRPRREHAADRAAAAPGPGRRRPRLHPAAVVVGQPDLGRGSCRPRATILQQFDPNGVADRHR